MEEGNLTQDGKQHCKNVPTAAGQHHLCLFMEQMISGSLGAAVALAVIASVSLQRPTMEHVTKLAMAAIGCTNMYL